MSDDEMEIVGPTEYAKRLGIGRAAVVERINRGTIPATKNSKGHWEICVQEAEKYGTTGNRFGGDTTTTRGANGEVSDLQKARTERERALAEIKQIELAQLKTELVSKKEVKKTIFEEARRVRDSFMNLPARLGPEIACETDPHRATLMLENEIRQILKDLSIGDSDESTANP